MQRLMWVGLRHQLCHVQSGPFVQYFIIFSWERVAEQKHLMTA